MIKKNIIILWATWSIWSSIVKTLSVKNNVIAIWRDKKKLLDIKNKYNITTYNLDLTNCKWLDSMIQDIMSQFKIDIVVNAAWSSLHGKFKDFSIDWINNLISSNYLSLVYFCNKIRPYFLNQRDGMIINIGSLSGTQWYENGTVYCSVKSAVNTFLETLAIEGQSYGIRVVNILAGNIATWTRDLNNPEVLKAIEDMLRPDDVSNMVSYLIWLNKNVYIQEIRVKPTKPMVKFSSPHSKNFLT